MRRLCLMLLVAGLVVGCESVRPVVQNPAPKPLGLSPAAERLAGLSRDRGLTSPVLTPPSSSEKGAESGSASTTQPVSAALSQEAAEDTLTLATKCLERDDHRGAAIHLAAYVQAHPDQPLFRLRLAELYQRGDRLAEARFHYERFIADAQGGPALRPHLVGAHIKLMEIAQQSEDRFAELLHRGVGLLLLVKEQDGTKERDEVFCEEMLCKSLRALQDAKEMMPGDPRVRVYLAEALERTGNRRAATAERAAARTSVVSGELTPTERRPLLLGE